jgi:hypothetical protein
MVPSSRLLSPKSKHVRGTPPLPARLAHTRATVAGARPAPAPSARRRQPGPAPARGSTPTPAAPAQWGRPVPPPPRSSALGAGARAPPAARAPWRSAQARARARRPDGAVPRPAGHPQCRVVPTLNPSAPAPRPRGNVPPRPHVNYRLAAQSAGRWARRALRGRQQGRRVRGGGPPAHHPAGSGPASRLVLPRSRPDAAFDRLCPSPRARTTHTRSRRVAAPRGRQGMRAGQHRWGTGRAGLPSAAPMQRLRPYLARAGETLAAAPSAEQQSGRGISSPAA